VSHVSHLASNSCPHELRPGTTVCLHCRWEARTAARQRRNRMLVRGSSALAVLATLGVIGLVGRVALHGRTFPSGVRVATAAVTRESNGESAKPPAPNDSASQQGQISVATNATNATNATVVAAAPMPAPTAPTAPALTPAPSAASKTVAVAPTALARPAASRPPVSTVAVVPVVPQGRSLVGDSLLVVRADSSVTLSFDRTMVRTRIPDKFERFVRSTLPALYGAVADSALSRIPEGGLARQGDLINELPARGMRIPVAPGLSIALYPITRSGRDGPLVTQYRTLVVRD
jgi:hypothetical protein